MSRRRQFGDVGQGWASFQAPARAAPQTSFAVYSGVWKVHLSYPTGAPGRALSEVGAGSFTGMTKAQLQQAAAVLLVDVLKQVGEPAPNSVKVLAVADSGEVVASAGVA